jgi:hypothetical protein
MFDAPSSDDLRAYRRGLLSPGRFAEIERWLDTQPAPLVERLLEEAASDEAGLLAAAAPPPPNEGFLPDAGAHRLRHEADIGTGGMATVAAARDRSLERVVALKTLRPRQPGESLEAYHLRAAAFRREAALTAGLEHPAIVPVYDVGVSDGAPAFTMKRVAGTSLGEVVASGARPSTGLVENLLRVAEAVAYAHSRRVVHRDLTPSNILLGDFGAVYVLDWGVAAAVGEGAGVVVGTTAWMAPEQLDGVPADPRMDVFALGGLLMLVLTGRGPRHSGTIDLAPLSRREVPSGLAALVRRCLAADPAQRYPDAGAVAAELRRWLDDGLTLAQQAGPVERAWLRLRRSAPARGTLVAGACALALVVGVVWFQGVQARREAAARLAQLVASTPDDHPEALQVAIEEVRGIERRHGLPAATAVAERWRTIIDLAQARAARERLRARLDGLLARIRISGPWAGEADDWRAALVAAGLDLSPAAMAGDRMQLASHPLRGPLAEALTYWWHALSLGHAEHGADTALAAHAAQLLAEGGPSEGWRALGRLLKHTEFQAHQPVFCPCADSDAALGDPASAAVVLALYGPDERLVAFARGVLAREPGAFWPLIASARAALDAGESATAQQQALIASGSEPASLYPQLILAYVALARGDIPALAAAVARGLAANPAHSELLVLRAVALARSGQAAEAQAIVARLDAGHLQYHLSHRVGHPMERGVDALVAAGLAIPRAEPRLGPLVPHHHH